LPRNVGGKSRAEKEAEAKDEAKSAVVRIIHFARKWTCHGQNMVYFTIKEDGHPPLQEWFYIQIRRLS
jgi:hypothetical protein